jgi:hypothetical protein
MPLVLEVRSAVKNLPAPGPPAAWLEMACHWLSKATREIRAGTTTERLVK